MQTNTLHKKTEKTHMCTEQHKIMMSHVQVLHFLSKHSPIRNLSIKAGHQGLIAQ